MYQAFVGSNNGTVTVLNLSKLENEDEKSCLEHKFVNVHKNRISSINVFEDNYLLVMSWDGLSNLYNLTTK